MVSQETILGFDPHTYHDRNLPESEIIQFFDLCDAVWIHDGDPKKPHAELTRGKCSNGFFDCMRVLKYPNLCEILARQLVKKLIAAALPTVNYVMGSPYAAITLSYEVAKALNAVHAFAEKDPSDPKGKRFVWRRESIPGGSAVLQVEELITTAGTLNEVRRAVDEGNPEPVNWLPFIGVVVHRPPELPVDYEGRKTVALIEREVWAVDPEDCPLCKAGSPRLRPKTHWAELDRRSLRKEKRFSVPLWIYHLGKN